MTTDTFNLYAAAADSDALAVPSPPYTEPFYDERTWTPQPLAEDWERLMLTALRHGYLDSVEGIIVELEKQPKWRRRPYLHSVFGPSTRPATFAGDILAADSGQLRRWREVREVRFARYSVARDQQLLAKLAERDGHTWQYLAGLRETVHLGFVEVEARLEDIKRRSGDYVAQWLAALDIIDHSVGFDFDPDATAELKHPEVGE